MRPVIVARYNRDLYSDPHYFTRTVNRAVERLRPHADKFEVIAFRGTSGAMFAPAIASALGKHLLNVRKQDGHHEEGDFSGALHMATYLIVDDLIATGTTLRTIQSKINNVSPESECVGYYLWNWDELVFRGDGIARNFI